MMLIQLFIDSYTVVILFLIEILGQVLILASPRLVSTLASICMMHVSFSPVIHMYSLLVAELYSINNYGT